MRRHLIQLASLISKAMPNNVKKGIIQALAKDEVFARQYGRRAMSAFSSYAGVSALMANGKCGNIISAPNDFAVHRIYAETGEWATSTTNVVKEFFENRNKSGYFLDIGANIGMTTIPIVQEFPDVLCMSFEPDPTNFANLRNNLLLNCSTKNYKIVQAALFKELSELSFEISDGNLGGHKLIAAADGSNRRSEYMRKLIRVKAIPLDDFVADIGAPLAVKIDVEGAEPYVVQGGQKVLAKADLIIMEWSPYLMDRLGGNFNDILDFVAIHFQKCEIQAAEGNGPSRTYSLPDAVNFLKAGFEQDKMQDSKYFDLIITK